MYSAAVAVFADGDMALQNKVAIVPAFSAVPSDAPAVLVAVATPRQMKVQSSTTMLETSEPPSTHALHRSALLARVS